MKKKVALCLHGYFNNKEDPNSGLAGYLHIKEKILNRNIDCDVYIHSWEPDKADILNTLYAPKNAIYLPQRDFSEQMIHASVSQDYFDKGFDRQNSIYAPCNLQSTFSFLNSRKRSIQLALQSGIQYDCIITARFDLGQRDKNGNWKYYVSKIGFDEENDMNYVYSAMWDQLNAGYADQWFYSNQENMQILAGAESSAWKNFKPGSLYENLLTTGWPDSNFYDYSSTVDPRQFTNEMLLSEKSKTPMKYPLWQCINNHLFYKYFFIESGLYSKSAFVIGK